MQDSLLNFEIPAVVLTPARAGTLALKSEESRVRDVRFAFVHDADVCRIQCSREMAVILATDIVLWASAADLSPERRAACEAAMATITRLLQDGDLTSPIQPELRDRTA